MDGIRQFFTTPAGKVVAGVFVVGAVVVAFFAIRSQVGPSEAADLSRSRVFICSQSGKAFRYELQAGDKMPVVSPHSKSRTGYLAEMCYWTADGKTKKEPTAVLLNSHKGSNEPTFCPDCGRLVVGLNPPPMPGSPPPPTRNEYQARDRSREE